MKKLEFKLSKIGFLKNISFEWMYSKWITPWQFKKMLNGGYGETVEDLVWEYLKEIYKDISRAPKNKKHDFHIKENSNFKYDIRRVSKEGTVCLGHTNASLTSVPWNQKAIYLDEGGYCFSHINEETGIDIYYMPAKQLLNDKYTKTKTFGNNVKLEKIFRMYGEFGKATL